MYIGEGNCTPLQYSCLEKAMDRGAWEAAVITICKIDDQCKFNAWSRALKASALGHPRRMGWGQRWMGGSGLGDTCAPWLIHVNVWHKPLQYCSDIPHFVYHSSVDINLDCFEFWTIMNKATKNFCANFCMSEIFLFLLSKYVGIQLLDPMATPF